MRTDEATQARKLQGYLEHVEKLPPTIRECAACSTEFDYSIRASKYCSTECSGEYMRNLALESRSPLRKVYEDGTPDQVLEVIKEESAITEDGCWEWKQLDSTGYPRAKIGGKHIAVHRLSLEAKHEAPLGSQAAHHMCANAKCVNPEHLQPVTHRENTAEMLARHSYLDRIAELEEVIRTLDPGHEVLNRVPIK